jgi:Arc/MetJ-type ribon-helix-helix transcriptional regulator
MIGGMKVKTSVTISQELLDEMDGRVSQRGRSHFVETAVREHLRSLRRAELNERDIEILNQLADDPDNQRELEAILADAVPWWELGDDVELLPEVEARLRRDVEARGEG